jgi:prepilin-type N-terminal cleavage/methylation domain-containing protein
MQRSAPDPAARRRTAEAGVTLVEILVSIVILGIITTFLVGGWINLQRASTVTVAANDSRASARDAIDRLTSEIRVAQPSALPTPAPTETTLPTGAPPLLSATPWEVRFFSAFNASGAGGDGSGVGSLRLCRLYLETGGSSDQKAVYLQRDLDNDGAFSGPGDQTTLLTRMAINKYLVDTTGDADFSLFTYGYRASSADPVQWTTNGDGALDLDRVVAVSVRLVVDADVARSPSCVDTRSTVRLRNANGQ